MADVGLPLIDVRELATGYRDRQVLHEVNLAVPAGSVVALIGHNGAGKSTLLKALFGLLPAWSGHIMYDGSRTRLQPHALLKRGVVYVPQGGRVFTHITVRENIEIGLTALVARNDTKPGLERALAAFPALKRRLTQIAGTLSGGEKQMLSLASAVALRPRVLLVDEPSLGLAASLVPETLERLGRSNRDDKVTLLIAEQKVREVLGISGLACCLKLGRVTFVGPAGELLADTEKLRSVFL